MSQFLVEALFLAQMREMTKTWANQTASASRRSAGQVDGSDNLSATLAADLAFPAAVAESLGG
jgi:hypothetical protein